jgi:hypothetical protein
VMMQGTDATYGRDKIPEQAFFLTLRHPCLNRFS